MASLLDYLQNPALARQPQQVEMVQTQLPGYTPPQVMQMQQPQQQQQQGVDPADAYKLGKNLQGAFGGTSTATAASMPPVGILNPAAYSSAMNAGPAMQMVGLDMGGLTAGLPGMGGASGAAGTASAGGAAGAGFGAIAGPIALGAYGADRYNKLGYGNGLKDFYTDSWQKGLLEGSHLTKNLVGGKDSAAGKTVDAVSSFGKVAGDVTDKMVGSGGPANPLTWLNAFKKIGKLF